MEGLREDPVKKIHVKPVFCQIAVQPPSQTNGRSVAIIFSCMTKYDEISCNMTKFMTKLAIQNTKNIQNLFGIGNDPSPIPPL